MSGRRDRPDLPASWDVLHPMDRVAYEHGFTPPGLETGSMTLVHRARRALARALTGLGRWVDPSTPQSGTITALEPGLVPPDQPPRGDVVPNRVFAVLVVLGSAVTGTMGAIADEFFDGLPVLFLGVWPGILAMLVGAHVYDRRRRRWQGGADDTALVACRVATHAVMVFGSGDHACGFAVVLPDRPTWAACLRCREPFRATDAGFIRPTLGQVPRDYHLGMPGATGSGYVMTGLHLECAVAEVAGHLVGVCGCTGWVPRSRTTAREVLRRVVQSAAAV